MSHIVDVKYIPEHLLVGRYLRNSSQGKTWYAMYLHEGGIYHIPGADSQTFNAARDIARTKYRKAELIKIDLSDFIPGPQANSWDIYGAEDGWRMEFSYSKAANKLSYTQPGKSTHKAEQNTVELVIETSTPVKLTAEPPLDPVLSASDHDFVNCSANLPFLVQQTEDKVYTKADLFEPEDPLADQAAQFPAYWKPLPKHWAAIDTYRVDILFPLNDSRLTHARKKLLVCGTRTGGKSIRKDIAEAYATLGQWLAENPED